MIYNLTSARMPVIAFIGIVFAFALTCFAIAKFNKYLPKDMGRQFAHDGKLSAGKPRGAGIIFIFTFVIAAVLFSQINIEIAIYLVLIVIEMLTGYFDDAAEKPWGEYLKGALDLAVAIVVAVVFLHYNTSKVTLAIFDTSFVIPPVFRNTYGCACVGVNKCDKLFRWRGWSFGNTYYHYDHDIFCI